ncbi:MAG TPA: hypothetical protein VKP66_11855 [Steroidobacteraceae bacterium]|nr:hypothetical protein [Steroidobacteraceae bacterium]
MRRLKITTRHAATAMALALGIAAAAEAGDGMTTSISGYGTVGGTFTSDSKFAYHHGVDEFTGASTTLDVGLESRLGVQAVFDFGSGFSVTAQELAKERADKSFDLGTEWLYAQYQATSDLKLRLGRVVLPAFLLSDSRNVGYAATWFRAPNELYALEPFQNLDGGQVVWHHGVGPVAVGLQMSYGTTRQNFLVNGLSLPSNANYGLNESATIEYGDFLVRAAQTKLVVPTTIPLSATYAISYDVVDKFTTVGVQYDDGKTIAMGEWAKRTQNTGPGLPLALGKSTSWYMAGGRRFGKLTPMVIYGKVDQGLTLLGPSGNFGAWSGSLRYDLVRNVALKAQLSRAQAADSVYWVANDPTSTKYVNVYSVGADFVF